MITPGFSLTATERVLPKLALDFTTASLDPRITFTRALNTATVVNSSGYITSINANLPRFDYDPITLACKGLLIEEARTNLIAGSNDFGNASYWNTLRMTRSVDATISPNGSADASKFTEDSATNTRGTQTVPAITITSGANYTYPVYLNGGTRRYVSLIIADSATGLNAVVGTFDLQTGAQSQLAIRGSGVAVSTTVTPVGNNWYRCSVTGNIPSASAICLVSPCDTGTPTLGTYGRQSYTGNGSSYFYAVDAQLELGAFSTSYIPTTTVAVLRNADVATMTGTNFSSWYNASQGSLLVQGSYFSTGSAGIISINDGTTNNRMTIQPLNTTQLNFRYVSSSGNFTGVSPSFTAASTFKTAFGYIANSQAAYLGTSAYSSISSQSVIPTATQMQFGLAPAVLTMSGYIQKVSYWPQKLTNAELAAFTK